MRTALLDIVLIGLISLAVGAYFVYRGFQAKKVEDMNPMVLQSAAATQCQFEIGNFEGNSVGTMRIYEGNVLFNVQVVGTANGFSGRLHLLQKLRGPLTVYLYPETKESLPAASDQTEMLNKLIATLYSFPWKCSPWWIPSSSAFAIPK